MAPELAPVMALPVLFVIDDDAGVVHALRDDLGRRFGEDFRVIAETSAAAGLARLGELAAGHEPVALLIVDHDMSETPGVDFLARAHELHPRARRACEQAWMFGAHMVFSQPAAGLAFRGDEHLVSLSDGRQISARAVIVAPGIAWRRLGVPRLEALLGSGVFYGAAGTEARAMEGRDVFVVGAGNSAGQTALHLARHARQVTLLVRGGSLARSMSDCLIREIEATANVVARLRTEVTDGHGDWHLEGLTLRDGRRGRTEEVPAAALFVLIGGEPRTGWLPPEVQLERGYIRTGRDVVRGAAEGRGGTEGRGAARWPLERAPLPLETSVPGVFAAGDARYRSIKRVASAVGDGATVVRLAHEYLAAGQETGYEIPLAAQR